MSATILCAEDDRKLFRIHERALLERGFRVLGAHDGEQALSTARDEEPDLVLIDAALPKRDGLDVLEALRSDPDLAGRLPALVLFNGRVSPSCEKRVARLGDVAMLSKPVPIDRLVGRVQELVKEAGVSPGERSAPAVPKRGSLREVHLAGLLHAIHARSLSGVLLLESGKKKKAVQFRDGYPTAVRSNLITECLGNMLAERGQLTKAQLTESIRRVKQGEGLQGEILVAMDVMDEEALADALREQAEAKLFEIFEWNRGRFAVQPSRRLQRANTLALDGSPADMVLRGARDHVQLERVDSFLAHHAESFVAAAENPFYRFQSIDLNEGEQKQLTGLDGKHTLKDFASASERLRRTLYALLMTEMLELRSGPSSSPGLQIEGDSSRASRGDDSELRGELTRLAKSLREKNYYEVLEIPTTADDKAVKAAYERHLQRVHPDRYRNASGAVRQVADEIHLLITRAYESLATLQARADYAAVLKKGAADRRERERSKKILAAETAFQRGEAALRGRDYEGALVFFGSAMEQMPDEGEYHAHYGWCLHLCHPDNEVIIQEAMEHIQRGIKLSRDREKPYLFLGRIYKVVGRTAMAEKMFTRAVQIRSDCVEALRELRLLNMRRDKSSGLMRKLLRR